MSTIDDVDEKIAALLNAKQHWNDSGQPEDFKQHLLMQMDSFSWKSDIHNLLLETIRRELVAESERVSPNRGLSREGSTQNRKLPVRNHGRDIPGHVSCFNELHGLIHGGIVYKRNYTLVCKAYRQFSSQKAPACPPVSIAVVAGICEQKDLNGKVIDQFTTAERLQYCYQSTAATPQNVYVGGPPVIWPVGKKNHPLFDSAHAMAGYYVPMGCPGGAPGSDSGKPDRDIYGTTLYPTAYGTPNMYAYEPTYETAIENALCDPPVYVTDGFPICTPYLKVFSLGPDSDATIVIMIGAFREQNGSGYYCRKAKWYTKTFRSH